MAHAPLTRSIVVSCTLLGLAACTSLPSPTSPSSQTDEVAELRTRVDELESELADLRGRVRVLDATIAHLYGVSE
jgi:uncharacterized protein YceH (UPF0502 family)